MVKEMEEELGIRDEKLLKGPKILTAGKHKHFTQ